MADRLQYNQMPAMVQNVVDDYDEFKRNVNRRIVELEAQQSILRRHVEGDPDDPDGAISLKRQMRLYHGQLLLRIDHVDGRVDELTHSLDDQIVNPGGVMRFIGFAIVFLLFMITILLAIQVFGG